VLLVAHTPDSDLALLRRLLTADRESLMRRGSGGVQAMHVAGARNVDALKLRLCSGLPHLTEAIKTVASMSPMPDRPFEALMTPLHAVCGNARWDAALALLTAGARVDIAGNIGDAVLTIADWARKSPACIAV
jgi:hypothetical protein